MNSVGGEPPSGEAGVPAFATPIAQTQLAQTRSSRFRLTVGVMIFLVTVLNFSDRGIFGAVGPMLMENFHLGVSEFGMVGGAFGIGYVLSTFLGGVTLRLCGGPTRVFVIFVSAWSIALGATAFATGYWSLLIYRALFGFCEGVIFPASQELAGRWFPAHERGRIASWCLTLGQPVGPLLVTPLVVAITTAFGWRVPFVIWMVIGLLWAFAAWRLLTDDPRRHRRVTAAELEAIGQGTRTEPARMGGLEVLSNPLLWVSGLCFFASAYVLYFLLIFFPVYLVQERHIPYSHVGLPGAVPFLGLAVGAIAAGWALDRLWVLSGGNFYISRTLWAAGSQFLAGTMFIIVALTTASFAGVLAMIFFAALFAYAANPVFFALPMDVMPRQAGQAGALVTGIGSSAGIFAPVVTGVLVQATGSYASAILVVAAFPIISSIVLVTFDPLSRLARQQAARCTAATA